MRAGKNICSGLAEEGEKRSNINRNKNYTRPVVAYQQQQYSHGFDTFKNFKTDEGVIIMMKWRKRRIFPLYNYYASLDFFANSLVLIFSIPLDKRNDSNCLLLLNNSIKEYKTHSVAYTGSYAVILLYNNLLVHNAMTVSQGPLLSRYSSM